MKLITDLEFASVMSVGPEPCERAAGMSRDNRAIAQWGQGHERACVAPSAAARNSIKLQRKQRQLQWMGHALSVRVTEAGETEYRLNHVAKRSPGVTSTRTRASSLSL